MTKEQFAAAHKHLLMGLMLDCFLNGHRKGAEASMYVTTIQSRVMEELNRMYDSLQPKPAATPVKPEVQNGKPTAGVQPGR